MRRSLLRSGRSLLGALLFSSLLAIPVSAQGASPVGDWEGTLAAGGQELPIIFHVTEAEDGTLTSTLDSPSQGGFGIPTGETTFDEGTLTITVPDISGSYEGTMSEDGDSFIGTWTQVGQSFELNLTRAES